MKVCNNKLENESGYVSKSFSLSYLLPKPYYVSETINANYYGYFINYSLLIMYNTTYKDVCF